MGEPLWAGNAALKQARLKGRLQQLLLGVLAGVGHKAVAQVAQAVLRAQLVVDIQAAAASFGHDFTAQHHVCLGSAKEGLDLRTLCASPNHICRKLVAKQKAQRFKNKALARSGFTRKHVHAG